MNGNFDKNDATLTQLRLMYDFDSLQIPRTDFSGFRHLKRVNIDINGVYDRSFDFSGCESLEFLFMREEGNAQRPNFTPLISSLAGCHRLRELYITNPCWVDFAELRNSCPNLRLIGLDRCQSNGPLALPESLRILEIADSTFTHLGTLPETLRRLEVSRTPVPAFTSFPDGLRDMHLISTSTRELPALPGGLTEFEMKGDGGAVTLPEFNDGLKRIVLENLSIERLPPIPKSAEVEIVECVFGESVVIEGKFKRLEVMGLSHSDDVFPDLSPWIGDVSVRRIDLNRCVIDPECLLRLAKRCKTVQLLELTGEEFPDLSATFLRSLHIDFLPEIDEVPLSKLPPGLKRLEIPVAPKLSSNPSFRK